MKSRTVLGIALIGGALAMHTGAAESDVLERPVTWPVKHEAFKLLVFSKTTEFRHESIPAGIGSIRKLGRQFGFEVEATEDASAFTPENLARFKVVLFLSTSGDVLDNEQQKAFEGYIQGGGGFVGVHGASATEYDWAWYGQLVGAFFKCHPVPQEADVYVENSNTPSTAMLPACWRRFDEWYDYRTRPEGCEVLLTVDEDSYEGATFGEPHPIAWQHEFDGGRSWYTAMGHTDGSFSESLFRLHILGGIQYAAGLETGKPDR